MFDKPYIDMEFFPCAGGMGEGFRRAGIIFDVAIELEADHCASYEFNLSHRPLRMDAHDFLRLVRAGGWRPQKPLRLLVADPPCTPWSHAGKRMGELDPRDCLKLTCDLIRELQPSMYLIGNVPGLDDGPNLHVVQRTIGALAELGYCTADFARLDAANYGVPQHRIRPFWFGHKHGPCIQWPAPTHGDPDDLRDQVTLPGIEPLIPWVTCRQALGHLSAEDLGRPIRLRHRESNSKQHGSVPERPARVVGTSNLSDGNVMLGETQTRAGKRGKHGVPQGKRKQEPDQPSDTVTRHLHHTIIGDDLREYVEVGGHLVPLKQPEKRKRVPQSKRTTSPERPAKVVHARPPRAGTGDSTLTLQPESRRHLTAMDKPGSTITRNTHGDGSILVNTRHAPATGDSPAPTLGAKQRGQRATVLATSKHPPSRPDAVAMTVRATDGGGSVRALEWPWQRPSTTVQRDERLAPPGHHDEYSIMSMADAVVISEKAAAILQGFPEDWKFVGQTKKARWSQIGQAMPPPLAHAVAESVNVQYKRTPLTWGLLDEAMESLARRPDAVPDVVIPQSLVDALCDDAGDQ